MHDQASKVHICGPRKTLLILDAQASLGWHAFYIHKLYGLNPIRLRFPSGLSGGGKNATINTKELNVMLWTLIQTL